MSKEYYDKFCLGKGEYFATLTHIQKESDKVHLIWVVDTGADKRHKIFDTYTYTKLGAKKMRKFFSRMAYEFDLTPTSDPSDLELLIGTRCLLTVDYLLDKERQAWVNVIGDYQITDSPAEINPLEKNSGEIYTKESNPKKLPI